MYNQGSQPPVTLISIALRNLKPGLENIIKEQEQQRGRGGGTRTTPWETRYLDKGLEKETGKERRVQGLMVSNNASGVEKQVGKVSHN